MKELILILLVVAIAALSSCSTKEEITPQLPIFSIENVDDELGLAYGTIQEVNNSEITTFDVVTKYSAITYDSINHIHYLNLDKLINDSNSLTSINVKEHKLAGY